jgi:hypothetical protein
MRQDKVVSGLFSIFDAARELGSISPWTLRKHISQGNVRVIRQSPIG